MSVAEAANAPELDVEDVANVLSVRRRRLVIEILDEQRVASDDPTLSLRDLADLVVEREVGEDFDTTDRKATYVGLYQNHMDCLADVGAVEWDSDRSLVAPGPNFDNVADSLEALGGATRQEVHEDSDDERGLDYDVLGPFGLGTGLLIAAIVQAIIPPGGAFIYSLGGALIAFSTALYYEVQGNAEVISGP